MGLFLWCNPNFSTFVGSSTLINPKVVDEIKNGKVNAMSLFDKLFGGEKPQKMPDVYWNHIENIKELDEIAKDSFEKPVAIFKHSTTCGISRMAWNQFQKKYNISHYQMDFYYLDLLAHRDISNEIASRFGVIHQSPQLIVIKDGKSVYNTSHESIDAGELSQFV